MRNILRTAVAAVLAGMLALGGASAAGADEGIFIPDEELRICVSLMLGVNSTEPISQPDAERLTQAQCQHHQGIADLSGLERFPNLRFLYLRDTAVTTLDPLAGMPNLETILMMVAPQLSDISAVADLPALYDFNGFIMPNQDLSAFGRVDSLRSLRLARIPGVSTAQLEFLRDLPELEHLALEVLDLVEVPDLSRQRELITLSLATNDIPAVPDMSSLPKLEEFWAGENRITSLDFLATVSDTLVSLQVEENTIEDLSPLALERGALPNLNQLGLHQNAIYDLTPLRGRELEGLTLQDQVAVLPSVPLGITTVHPIRSLGGALTVADVLAGPAVLDPATGEWTPSSLDSVTLAWDENDDEWGSGEKFSGEATQPVHRVTLEVTSPQDLRVPEGKSAAFTASARASNDRENSVFWERRSADGTVTKLPGATEETLLIDAAGPELSGTHYRAVFTNPEVADPVPSDWAQLTVTSDGGTPDPEPTPSQSPPGKTPPPVPGLPDTGTGSGWPAVGAAFSLLLGGLALLRTRARRPRPLPTRP